MERKEYLPILLEEFIKWYRGSHEGLEDSYSNEITKKSILSLSRNDFIEFFYKFVYDGGKIQSGGQRKINGFKNETLIKRYPEFREYILEPFSQEFDEKNWLFHRRCDFENFGIGIASIYLNRIDKNKYSIINNKTIGGLKALDYKISDTKTWKNYLAIHNIQANLIKEYDTVKNYFMADAINEFIIGKPNYIKELVKIKDSIFVANDKIGDDISVDTENALKEIKDIIDNDDEREYITINHKTYKRNQYLMEHIKKHRGYKCQFCGYAVLTKENNYYVEACHITPVANKGKDGYNNILILCPNCHKLFDMGKREEVERTDSIYKVKLNNEIYTVNLD
jgi:predicted HNH restriction endonuclease